MKLSVIIPVYNEAKTLLQILQKVEAVEVSKEIILVDDGSTDGSVDILKKLDSENRGYKIVFKSVNSGKGASLKEGFKVSTGDYVIVQDADLEYDPQDYKLLLAQIETGEKVVYGSRFYGDYKDMTTLHYVGNKFLTLLTNILYGQSLSDMETCYKLIPGDFARSITIKSQRFNFEPEITAKILKAGYHIKEVPITYKGRTHSEGKKITWRDGISAVTTLIKFRFFN
ncbi:glycosyltransferase family 2 protein [candidate division WWE3 bacterium]|uniref:Glycosyltransferase family 2 protein n=1 Tax=candidate division WWE3 bacterium TaxID=2053526 RepID=A0A955J1I4_UNCKA|nr:glycosyltransferase family 2 protein [candidate division WWE3 bacterium]